MDKHQDFLPEEVEEQNQPLIRRLHDVYQPGQQDARSLERMRSRLFSTDSQAVNTQQKTLYDRQNQQNLYDQQKHVERIGTMNSSISNLKTLRSRREWLKLATIAAVLLIALAIGTLVVTLNLIHRPSLSTKPTPVVIPTIAPTPRAMPTATTPSVVATPSPTPVPLPHTPTRVLSIHMLDSTTGWVTCVDGSILRTTDGGLNWLDVTPQALLAIQQQHGIAGSVFPDGSTAWILVTVHLNTTSPDDLQAVVFHTSDAGQTWQRGTLPQNDSSVTAGPLYEIAAVSSQDAWVLDTRVMGAAAGGPHGGARYSIVNLYHTTDGGNTWTAGLNAPISTGYTSVPSISFANQQTGIITGELATSAANMPMVYLTQDGGEHWAGLTIQSPNPSQWQLTELLSPQFLTANDGVLTASFYSTATQGSTGVSTGQGFSVFSTHDGGKTWTSSPIVDKVGAVITTRFVNTQQGYILAFAGQAAQMALYTTNDGGQHWNSTALNLPDYNVNNGKTDLVGFFPDFSSSTTGWALYASQSDTQPAYPTSLYTTVDGGKTWTQVHAHFPPFITPASAY